MRSVVGFLFGLAVGIAVIVRAAGVREPARSGEHATPEVAEAAAQTPVPPMTSERGRTTSVALVARLRGAVATRTSGGRWDAVFVIEGGRARPLALPETADRAVMPVTDGRRVYAYVSGSATGSRSGARRLAAFSLGGREEETVTDGTPLVTPRGLFVSPTGAFLGFFLDNRSTEETELWTYDTSSQTKRVSVENLRRSDVRGPFFASDGSFLLISGSKVLRGSPRRTGVDILPAVLPSDVRWDSGVAVAPAGDRIALLTVLGDARTPVGRVVELSLDQGTAEVRHAMEGRLLNLLGWNADDAIILTPEESDSAETPKGSVVLVLRGDEIIEYALEEGTFSPVVSGDGGIVGVLRESPSGVEFDEFDLRSSVLRASAELPFASVSSPPDASRPASVSSSPIRLLQVLRVRSPVWEEPTPIAFVQNDPAAVLRFLTGRIRELADAPLPESVHAERVWFLETPRHYYVDYRVGTTLWRRLVRIQESRGILERAAVVGVFASANGEWVLARGEDLADRSPTALYEYEADLRQWVEKPLAEYSL